MAEKPFSIFQVVREKHCRLQLLVLCLMYVHDMAQSITAQLGILRMTSKNPQLSLCKCDLTTWTWSSMLEISRKKCRTRKDKISAYKSQAWSWEKMHMYETWRGNIDMQKMDIPVLAWQIIKTSISTGQKGERKICVRCRGIRETRSEIGAHKKLHVRGIGMSMIVHKRLKNTAVQIGETCTLIFTVLNFYTI